MTSVDGGAVSVDPAVNSTADQPGSVYGDHGSTDASGQTGADPAASQDANSSVGPYCGDGKSFDDNSIFQPGGPYYQDPVFGPAPNSTSEWSSAEPSNGDATAPSGEAGQDLMNELGQTNPEELNPFGRFDSDPMGPDMPMAIP